MRLSKYRKAFKISLDLSPCVYITDCVKPDFIRVHAECLMSRSIAHKNLIWVHLSHLSHEYLMSTPCISWETNWISWQSPVLLVKNRLFERFWKKECHHQYSIRCHSHFISDRASPEKWKEHRRHDCHHEKHAWLPRSESRVRLAQLAHIYI
jgi:hypothetical protein